LEDGSFYLRITLSIGADIGVNCLSLGRWSANEMEGMG